MSSNKIFIHKQGHTHRCLDHHEKEAFTHICRVRSDLGNLICLCGSVWCICVALQICIRDNKLFKHQYKLKCVFTQLKQKNENMCKRTRVVVGDVCVDVHMCVCKTMSEHVCVCFGLRASPLDLEIRQGISRTHPPPGILSPAITTTTFNQQHPHMCHIQSKLSNFFIFLLIPLSLRLSLG